MKAGLIIHDLAGGDYCVKVVPLRLWRKIQELTDESPDAFQRRVHEILEGSRTECVAYYGQGAVLEDFSTLQDPKWPKTLTVLGVMYFR